MRFFFYLTLFYSNTIYIQQCYFIKSFTNICPHQNFIKKIYEKITYFFYCYFNFLLTGVFYKFGFSLLIPSNRLQILEYLPKKRKKDRSRHKHKPHGQNIRRSFIQRQKTPARPTTYRSSNQPTSSSNFITRFVYTPSPFVLVVVVIHVNLALILEYFHSV